ncbi:MAG: pyridoxal-phosphate dependent enzyme [Erysipelotrichaceae bacterium]|nr:pyridoxal-phosphate dependent enzyme [Erysipelotrichaceae bacterium]
MYKYQSSACSYKTTGPEIFEQCDHKTDALVCMAGAGGTILGLSAYFRKVNPDIYTLSVQPDPVSRRSRENPYCHIIDGVLNFDDVPEKELCGFVHHDLYDECMNIVTEDACKTAQAMFSKDGILFGTSGAAAFLAAVSLAKRQEFYDKNIIVIIPDGGDKYLSCPLYEY